MQDLEPVVPGPLGEIRKLPPTHYVAPVAEYDALVAINPRLYDVEVIGVDHGLDWKQDGRYSATFPLHAFSATDAHVQMDLRLKAWRTNDSEDKWMLYPELEQSALSGCRSYYASVKIVKVSPHGAAP